MGDFSAITRDPAFVRLYSTLGIPYRFWGWRRRHETVPFWTLNAAVEKAIGVARDTGQIDGLVRALSAMLTACSGADPEFRYAGEDLDRLFVLCAEYGAVLVLTMLSAYAAAEAEYITPAEIAEATGTAESGWRNKAASGALAGALKVGKQWLIPTAVLRAQCVDLPER